MALETSIRVFPRWALPSLSPSPRRHCLLRYPDPSCVYVPSHLHLNVTYLLEAAPSSPVRCKPDENSAVGWFGLEEAAAASSEPWLRERIYQKLNAKLAGSGGRGSL